MLRTRRTRRSASTDGARERHNPAGPTSTRSHRVLIIGGGTAGITVAARLGRANVTDVAVLEPSGRHWYQPLWTLVGAGLVDIDKTLRDEALVMPKGVRWIRDRAESVDPVSRTVDTSSGSRVRYDFLVLAPGIQLDWSRIPGLEEALRTDTVSSVYRPDLAPKTATMLRDFRGGHAVFTSPGTPLKCGGAPQKITYLAAEQFQRRGLGDRAHVVFANAGKVLFGIEPFATVLQEVVDRYGIDVRHRLELREVFPDRHEAAFQSTPSAGGESELVRMPYDVMHATPPQSAPDFVKRSPLATGPYGFVGVDAGTLQSPDYPEVFALGDVTDTPNAKTGAAVRKQAPVVVANLLAVMEGREPETFYDGYGSCPLVTAHNRVVLAEFDYTRRATPTIPLLDPGRERYSMYLLKRYGLPWMYWHLMLKGLA